MEQATLTPTRRLERGDGPLGGVAAGLADYFNVDVTLIRLGLVATTLLGGPAIPIAYIAAWIIVPEAETPSAGTPTAPAPTWATTPPPPPAPVPPVPVAPAPVVDQPQDTVVTDQPEVADGDAAAEQEADR